MAKVIPEALAEAARDAAHRVAVRYRGTEWSYGRLESEVDGLATTLRAHGIREGDRVGYWGPKRPESVAAFYAILRAGAVWVPIDAHSPLPWVRSVTRDCGLAGLVTTADRAAGLLPAEAARSVRLCVGLPGDDDRPAQAPSMVSWAEAIAAMPAVAGIGMEATDLAAIFYTSGSTGRPKGVMHHHRSLLTSARWLVERASLGPDDRMPVLPPLNFKMSTYGLISTVLARSTSILVSLEAGFRGSDLVDLVRSEGVTIWRSVAHAFQVLASAAPGTASLPSLRCVVVGGGPLRAADARIIRAAAPGVLLWHTYGSSESGTICAQRITSDPAPGERVPVGRPVKDARVVHLRDDGSVAGVGEEGEMVVWSPKLMIGYWADPVATASVLVPDPTGQDPDERWYRTRDLVRLRPDGVYEFVARRDEMVKSRGFRVELGQVERALGSHPQVVGCAAVAVPHREWGSAIVVFATLNGALVGGGEPELRKHVAERLPIYMVPQRIHVIAELPRTLTGKIDRPRLLALVERGGAAEA